MAKSKSITKSLAGTSKDYLKGTLSFTVGTKKFQLGPVQVRPRQNGHLHLQIKSEDVQVGMRPYGVSLNLKVKGVSHKEVMKALGLEKGDIDTA